MQRIRRIALRIELMTAVAALATGVLASLWLSRAGEWLVEEMEDAASAMRFFQWRLITTGLVVGFGLSLYACRRWNRTMFGVGELALGVFLIWNIVGQLSGGNDLAVWLMVLAGSTFVIVRGCDNIEKGIEKRQGVQEEKGTSI
jgi:hypothetical protein